MMNNDSRKNETAIITSEKLILDTHILLWYCDGVNLSEEQIQRIESFRMKNQLYISAITIWEIAMLYNKGKVIFSIPLNEWVNKILSVEGLNVIELSNSILIESCSLPNFKHKDPADRMIIASTRADNAYLFTFDQKIIDYGNKGYLKLLFF